MESLDEEYRCPTCLVLTFGPEQPCVRHLPGAFELEDPTAPIRYVECECRGAGRAAGLKCLGCDGFGCRVVSLQ
jgi:hypothetical protein